MSNGTLALLAKPPQGVKPVHQLLKGPPNSLLHLPLCSPIAAGPGW